MLLSDTGWMAGARGKQPGKTLPASAAEQVHDDFAMEEEHEAAMQAASQDGAGYEGDILEELPLAERLAEKQHQRLLAQAAAAAKPHQGPPAAAAARPGHESHAAAAQPGYRSPARQTPAHHLQASGKRTPNRCDNLLPTHVPFSRSSAW